MARADRLSAEEDALGHLSHAIRLLEESRELARQRMQHGEEIRGSDVAELYLTLDRALREIDEGMLHFRRRRARGTQIVPHPLYRED